MTNRRLLQIDAVLRRLEESLIDRLRKRVSEGGPGSGNFGHGGRLGSKGGSSTGIRMSYHAVQRMNERRKYQSTRDALERLSSMVVPDSDWYARLTFKGETDGYMVGTDGIVKTILGSWANIGKLASTGVLVGEVAEVGPNGRLSSERSIAYQLSQFTQADVDRWCELVGIDTLTIQDFRQKFIGRSWDDLASLLYARFGEGIAEGGAGSGNFGHSGRVGQRGGSGGNGGSEEFQPREVTSFSDLHAGHEYLDMDTRAGIITSDGRLIDTEGSDHADYIRDHPGVIPGVSDQGLKKDINRALVQAGYTRVRLINDVLTIHTSSVDTSSLKKLQRLYDRDLLPSGVRKVNWMNHDASTFFNMTLPEFLQSSRVTVVDGSVILSEFSPGQDLESIRAEYYSVLSDVMLNYMTSDRPITSFRNEFRRAANEAFTFSAYAGWADGRGSGPIPDSLSSWVINAVSNELTYIDSLFYDLKALRKDPDVTDDYRLEYIGNRAYGYTATLSGVYNQAKLTAGRELPLTFDGSDGMESCSTCQDLKGQTHPAIWWVENRKIPGPRPGGNENFECKGYKCEHYLRDPEGNVWTADRLQEVALLEWAQWVVEGGPGSGNFGHSGRVGQKGGSGGGGRRFGSESEAMAWGESLHQAETTPEEYRALRDYKGSARDINARLEGKTLFQSDQNAADRAIPELDSYLEKNKLPESVVVYRGVSGDQYSEDSVGKEFSQVGFMSTSCVERIGVTWGYHYDKSAILELSVPKGTPAAFLDTISYRGESEILLARGLKFKITDFSLQFKGLPEEYAVLKGEVLSSVSEGGPGSGNFGHSGRTGQRGGSGSRSFGDKLNIVIFDRSVMRSGERSPTGTEVQAFRDAVSDLDPAIQALGQPQGLFLSVEPGRAESSGASIYLDEKYLYSTSSVAQHEYIHTAVNFNDKIDSTIAVEYNPPRIYQHAEKAASYMRDEDRAYFQHGEQLVMNLTWYHPDRDRWIGLVKATEQSHYKMSWAEATAQVDAVSNYLTKIGVWK